MAIIYSNLLLSSIWLSVLIVVSCFDHICLSVQTLNMDSVSHSSSSISTTSSLPARQEVTSGAGVHGDWCSGTTRLPTPVEQWTTSLSGVQLFHPARLQAAGVPKPNTPSSPSGLCATGRTQLFILDLYLSRYFDSKHLPGNVKTGWFLVCSSCSGPGSSHLLPPEQHTGCECVCGPGVPQYQPVCHPHCGRCPAQLATGNREFGL